MTHNENILSIIAGPTERQRVVIVHRSLEPRDAFRVFPAGVHEGKDPLESTPDVCNPESLGRVSRPFCEQIQAIRDRPIVLRQQSFSPAVGWFTQSEMELTLHQWNAMRTTLVPNNASVEKRSPAPRRKKTGPPANSASRRPPIVSLDGEVISLPLHADQAVPA